MNKSDWCGFEGNLSSPAQHLPLLTFQPFFSQPNSNCWFELWSGVQITTGLEGIHLWWCRFITLTSYQSWYAICNPPCSLLSIKTRSCIGVSLDLDLATGILYLIWTLPSAPCLCNNPWLFRTLVAIHHQCSQDSHAAVDFVGFSRRLTRPMLAWPKIHISPLL